MDHFPTDVLSEIISLTSPMEASRFAVISKGFKSAADSDAVWDKFLLSDWPEILSRAVSPVTYATKKELYLSLCHSPILLDDGKLERLAMSAKEEINKGGHSSLIIVNKRMLSTEKRLKAVHCWCRLSTKGGCQQSQQRRPFIVGVPTHMWITWLCQTPWYWDWTSHPDSRFSEVAQLKSVCWLEITGAINTRLLSWKTTYGVYLVYKLDEVFYGLESAATFMRFLDERVKSDVRGVALLHLQPGDGSGQAPVTRDDGWMEVEMGSFYNDRGDDGDFLVKLKGLEGYNWKSGLIVQGIEFRPKP